MTTRDKRRERCAEAIASAIFGSGWHLLKDGIRRKEWINHGLHLLDSMHGIAHVVVIGSCDPITEAFDITNPPTPEETQ